MSLDIAIGIDLTSDEDGAGGVAPATFFVLMEDGVSFVLMEDGVSRILLE